MASEKKKAKNDVILILLLLALGLVLFLGTKLYGKVTTRNARLEVSIAGQVTDSYQLSQEGSYDVAVDGQVTNRFEIKDGRVSMVEADCPDLICVNHVAISMNGETIVCLPNKVVLRIVSDQDSDLDAIAQ